MRGTTVEVKVSRVVDGDTIRVLLPGETEDESLRILSLDTEESTNNSKPKTDWGVKAKERANEFFSAGDTVVLEFPGTEALATCLTKYRGNFGRLLVYVHKDGVDFQETMIKEGYSPYYNKYGNAKFEELHKRYIKAEQLAQSLHIGVWDQETVNGSVMRDYKALGVWWNLRARIIDDYRKIRGSTPDLLNTRLDYEEILTRARNGMSATIFTELGFFKEYDHGCVVNISSEKKTFSAYIPDHKTGEGQKIFNLLVNRYVSNSEKSPNRTYGYISGELSMYNSKPQMILTAVSQLSDTF